MEFEFGKSAVVDALDRVPEQFRGLYQERDGKFALADQFKGIAGAVDGLNKSLRAARKDADEAKKARVDLSPLGHLLNLEPGDEPPTLDAVQEALAKRLTDGGKDKVNYDKVKADLEKGHRKALDAKDAEVQAMQGTLVRHMVTSAAVQAIASQKGVPELLLPHIAARTRVVKEGAEYQVRVVDEAGDPRGDGAGGFMSIEGLVKEMKASPVFGRAFESEAPTGGGTRPGGPTRTPAGPPPTTMSANQKIAAGLEQRDGGARR